MPDEHALGVTPGLELRAFIIGAQKAGSTSLERYIARHPQAWSPRREVPFFETPEYERNGVGELRTLLRAGEPGHVAVLRRPNYLCLPEVPTRLAHHYPAVRLVAVLRDPVARFVSAYYHYMRYGLVPVEVPDEGIPQLLAGDIDAARWPRACEVPAFGGYGEALVRWYAAFPAAQLLIIDSETLRNRPQSVFDRVVQHVGLAPFEAPAPAPRASMLGVYDMRLVRARAKVAKLLYRVEDGARLRPRNPLPQLWDRVERRLAQEMPAPELATSTLEALRAYYKSDVSELGSLLGSAAPAFCEKYS